MFLLFVAPICHSKASDVFFSSCIFFSNFQQERRPVVPSLPQMFSWPCRQFCAQFFKNYLTSATFFNVTIICSSNSRASAFFLIYDFFFHFQQGQLPAAPTLPPNFGGGVANFFFSFSQFLPSFFQNWRKSANWLTICTPDYCHCFFYNLQTLNIYLMFKAKVKIKNNYLLLHENVG